MHNPHVIVLILSYNGKHLLADSISSYLANNYENFEIIVIDNGSMDETKNWVEKNYPNVFVLRTEINLGYSGGFNLGLDYAFNHEKADYALITNNDVKADSKVISELVKVTQTDEKIGFVTGKVYYYDKPDILQSVGKKEDPIRWNGGHIGNREVDNGQYDVVCERFFSDDIYMLVSKRLYDDIGGYDTNFKFQSEEYDWQAGAKKLGYKIFFTPYAKIWHKESMTIGKKSALKAYYDTRNPMIVILKHKSPAFFKIYFWHHLKNGVIIPSFRNFCKGKIAVSSAIWRGFFSGLFWSFKNKMLSTRHFF